MVGHVVQFYETDPFLCNSVADYLVEGLRRGDAELVVATQTHREAFVEALRARDVDVDAEIARGALVLLDARQTLDLLMVGDMPDRERFKAVIGGAVGSLAKRAAHVRAYGEMVDLLWRERRCDAALRLEHLWNELRTTLSFSLVCSYVQKSFETGPGLYPVCGAHDEVLPPEGESLTDSLAALRRAEESARAARDELQDMIQSSMVPIIVIDPAGVVTWANDAQLELLGVTADEYVGAPVGKFHVDAEVADELVERLQRGEAIHESEARLRTKDGALRHVLISSRARVRNGALGGVPCFIRDITDRKRAEQERERLIVELTRTVRLNEMFAGVLGHDLRNPLNTVMVAGDLLRDRAEDRETQRAAERLLKSATRMQHMIDQLLDFSRARMGGGISLEYAASDLGVVARDVVDELRVAHPDTAIYVTTSGDLTGDCDVHRMGQVFSNLVGNAVQHGREGLPVTIDLDGSGPDQLVITMRNRGAVDKEILPILFAPFRGTQQREGKNQGLGLGLFITDQIVRAHGGSLVATSDDDTTTFKMHIPRRAPRGLAVASFEAPPAPEPVRDPVKQQPVGVVTDATLRTLVKTIRDYAIFMLDPNGFVMSWNDGARLLKGYTADEIIGRHFSLFYPQNEIKAGRCERELEIARRDGQYEEQGWRLRKDGSPFWANVLLTALRDPDGTLIGFAKVTRDLTAQRELEQQRIRLAQTREAAKLRDELLVQASRELQAPLTALREQLETVGGLIGADNPALSAVLERTDAATRRLDDLVVTLLDVSRLASGRAGLEPERVDLVEMMRHAVERMRMFVADAPLTCAFASETVWGNWDRARIEQLVANLLAHAVQSAGGSAVEVALDHDHDDAVIEVRGSRGSDNREVGLRLFVVEQIARAHGGAVTTRITADGNARVQVRVPLHVASSALSA